MIFFGGGVIFYVIRQVIKVYTLVPRASGFEPRQSYYNFFYRRELIFDRNIDATQLLSLFLDFFILFIIILSDFFICTFFPFNAPFC